MTYPSPSVVDSGSIAAHTFQTPYGFTGCQGPCELGPVFSEPSTPLRS